MHDAPLPKYLLGCYVESMIPTFHGIQSRCPLPRFFAVLGVDTLLHLKMPGGIGRGSNFDFAVHSTDNYFGCRALRHSAGQSFLPGKVGLPQAIEQVADDSPYPTGIAVLLNHCPSLMEMLMEQFLSAL